jgi:hypothetical protein
MSMVTGVVNRQIPGAVHPQERIGEIRDVLEAIGK